MSFNRENVIWQSKDATWNRGFYVADTYDNGSDEDYDAEWDVEYDFGAFEWVATDLESKDAARASWTGSNPGGCTVVPYAGNEVECDAYDAIAAACSRARERAKQDQQRGPSRMMWI